MPAVSWNDTWSTCSVWNFGGYVIWIYVGRLGYLVFICGRSGWKVRTKIVAVSDRLLWTDDEGAGDRWADMDGSVATAARGRNSCLGHHTWTPQKCSGDEHLLPSAGNIHNRIGTDERHGMLYVNAYIPALVTPLIYSDTYFFRLQLSAGQSP